MMDVSRIRVRFPNPETQRLVSAIRRLTESDLLDESDVTIKVARLKRRLVNNMEFVEDEVTPIPQCIIDAFKE